mmetsp:Transcript_15404/g.33216  ORF Transcript_15404/g.33216 Transcript_15404/m.33216 type:complete len:154 (-) Transcript_15404:114-575(-)
MPGIFSACIMSARPGLSRDDLRGHITDERRRRRGFDRISCDSETSGTDSIDRSYDSGSIFENSQSTDSNNSIRVTDATERSTAATNTSSCRGFYSNKDNKAMIFMTERDERHGEILGSLSQQCQSLCQRQRKRQYQPSLSSSPCQWGYFVDSV